MTTINLAHYIDHTCLKPEAGKERILKLCTEAKEYGFATVCVNPCWVKFCAAQGVKVCTVIGFPLGASSTEIKIAETKQALLDGAQEIDMVINIGKLKDQDNAAVLEEIKKIVLAAESKPVKVIIETCLLTEEEKIRACKLAQLAGAAYVKTSTGFSSGGATVADIELMRRTVGAEMGVKASGGIKTKADALNLINAGANRLGTSSGPALLDN